VEGFKVLRCARRLEKVPLQRAKSWHQGWASLQEKLPHNHLYPAYLSNGTAQKHNK
jgi:hypothetical protein